MSSGDEYKNINRLHVQFLMQAVVVMITDWGNGEIESNRRPNQASFIAYVKDLIEGISAAELAEIAALVEATEHWHNLPATNVVQLKGAER